MSLPNNAAKKCSDESILEKRLACLADAGPQAISDRLDQLDRVWSAGRMTKVTIGVVIVAGLILTVLVDPWWLILPALAAVILLQYLFARVSWLGALFRVVGFRPGSEIDQEKIALKALRGDFKNLPSVLEIVSRDDLSRLEGEGGIAPDVEETKPDTREVVKQVVVAARC
jgi:hypothetical protein